MRLPFRRALFGAAVAAITAVTIPVLAAADSSTPDSRRHCETAFDEAQRVDMESFRDYEREIWRAGHDPDATTIFADSTMISGVDNIMAALDGHFTNREAIWEWTELRRQVHGCKSAVIFYETWYRIPRIDLNIHAITSVTYTWEGGRWLSIADQGTALP